MPLSSSVREYMSSLLHTAPVGVTLDHVMNTMTRLHVRHVPLVENGRIVAVATPEDVLQQLLEEGGPAHVELRVASRPIPAVEPTASVAEAARAMHAARVDYVIVGTLEAPRGILSSRDVVRAARSEFRGLPVSEYMDDPPPSVPLEAPLTDAARAIAGSVIDDGFPARHAVVGEDGLPIGVVSVRDIIYYAMAKGSLDGRVTDIMSPHLYYLDPAASLNEAVEEMAERDVSFLPVVYKARLLGGVYEYTVVKVAAGESPR